MKKFLLIFLTYLILFFSNIVRSEDFGELVEAYLINQIDEQRGYCIDIKGYKLRAEINRGIQAHTCYSYQGQIAVDQGFDRKKIKNNQFFLPEFNVCMEASSIVTPGKLFLKNCNLRDVQKFILMNNGRISLVSNKKLCLTASQEESRKGGGGSPVHLIRNLSLQLCSDKLMNYQKWNIRSNQ
ncbi:hypothetical protein OAB36_00925 [Pelagibacteraceae bacterium]|jgi:hypothetical protein|nr:hypothetical protein [Pelagibacteraceae bacterium]|tara:strand:+ start:985 stop:1533 length:549 start_codon:yes stop_codon:yes gene_type:complete